jgi:hypothetical protein
LILLDHKYRVKTVDTQPDGKLIERWLQWFEAVDGLTVNSPGTNKRLPTTPARKISATRTRAMILCDAGVLLCLVDCTQPQHKAYRNTVMRLAKPLVTTWSCLTEAMYLALHRGGWQMRKQLGQLLLDKLLVVYNIQESDFSRLLALMEQYCD